MIHQPLNNSLRGFVCWQTLRLFPVAMAAADPKVQLLDTIEEVHHASDHYQRKRGIIYRERIVQHPTGVTDDNTVTYTFALDFFP